MQQGTRKPKGLQGAAYFRADLAIPPDSIERVYRKNSLRILSLLLPAYIVAYLDRVNVSFAKLQMLHDLHFSETIYGLGAGIFFLGYFLFEVPSNIVLHRLGARVWFSRIMISCSVLSAAMMFVKTPASYYIARFLLGAAEAGFFPGIIFYLTTWYPTARRGKVIAVFMTGIAICGAVGSLSSGLIVKTFDRAGGLAGWQWLFLLEALPGAGLGFLILFHLKDNIEAATWLDQREQSLLENDLARDSAVRPEGSLTDAFRDPRVWYASLIYFCAATGLYAIAFWLPTILFEMGVTNLRRLGFLTAIPYSIAAVGMVIAGWSADKLGERRWHLAIAAGIGALGLVLSVLFAEHTTIALIALSFAALGTLSALPLFWSLPTAYLNGAAAAAGIAVINSFGNLAGFLSPYAVGWIKDITGSSNLAMYGVACIVWMSGVLVILGVPPTVSGRTQ